jgi:predicted murein hydrolase (TIGR00659 family)
VIAAVVWSALTIAVYIVAQALSRRFGDPVFLQPVLTSAAVLIAMLCFVHVPYESYARATSGITFMLAPATIALAVPLYRQLGSIRRSAPAMAAAILCGSATAAVSAVLIAHALGCDDTIVRSLAPKSVTVPVAMAVSAQIGGAPPLTAVFAVLSGIIGAMAAPYALKLWRAPFAGAAIGTTSHGIGTGRLYALDRTAAAFSSLAMGINAIATAVLLPPLAALVQAMMRR